MSNSVSRSKQLKWWLELALARVSGSSFFVLGYPGSGTTWVASVLKCMFDQEIKEHWAVPRVIHLHRFVSPAERTIYVFRDPRDVLVSCFFKSRQQSEAETLSVTQVQQELLPFFEESFARSGRLYDYCTHVRKGLSSSASSISYESLHSTGAEVLQEIVEPLLGSEFSQTKFDTCWNACSFSNRAGYEAGAKKMPLDWVGTKRKGIVGDWQNYFTDELHEMFEEYVGSLMTELGYKE